MSNSRRALRDFYKLPSEVASEAGSDVGSENIGASVELASDISRSSTPLEPGREWTPGVSDAMLEPEEEPLTKLGELDSEDADISQFVSKLVEAQTLPSFISTVSQIRREQVSLASAQRELVNDNYKKLIKAAEMLGNISAQGDLASVDALAESVETLAEWTAKLPAAHPKASPTDSLS